MVLVIVRPSLGKGQREGGDVGILRKGHRSGRCTH